jgi:hypothetical protein
LKSGGGEFSLPIKGSAGIFARSLPAQRAGFLRFLPAEQGRAGESAGGSKIRIKSKSKSY